MISTPAAVTSGISALVISCRQPIRPRSAGTVSAGMRVLSGTATQPARSSASSAIG
jgi:hypothetical protein